MTEFASGMVFGAIATVVVLALGFALWYTDG